MFNQKFQPFVLSIQNMQLAVQLRSKIAAYAIGYAIACNMALPSTEVENAQDYFRVNLEPLSKRVVSVFNEQILLDCNTACDMARNFWLLRYEAVHKCPRMDQIPGDFFSSVFGVSRFFAPRDVEFLNEHASNVNMVYQKACNIVQEYLNPKDAS